MSRNINNMNSFNNKDEYFQSDLQSIINDNFEESLYLEFKSAAALNKKDLTKKEISKDISSFANSDGGIIIYGIAELDHKAHSIEYINGREITKEWLENVIDSNIKRRINDLIIFPIRFDNDIEKTVYLIKIPASLSAPHMASDNRYYRRYNFKSVPMEEYEVRNLFNRVQGTTLIFEGLMISQKGSMKSGGLFKSVDFELIFQIKNVGNTIERNCKLEIFIPAQFYLEGHPSSNPIRQYYIRHNKDEAYFSVPNASPVFQNEISSIANANIRISAHSLHLASKPGIKIRLYYSSGTIEESIDLGKQLNSNNKLLSIHDFV